MKPLKLSSMLILIASALLLSGASSASADPPKPTQWATPNSHRETAPEQKPTTDNSKQEHADSERAGALSSATPDRIAESVGTGSDSSRATEEERHDRREESLEQRLICLTAILAIIEVITLFIFYYTMKANEVAANAAKVGADAAKMSADATKSSADAVVSQMQLLTRPNIEVHADTLITHNTEVTIYFTVINVGHTDARVLRQRLGLWRKYNGVPWSSEIPLGETVLDTLLPVKFAAYERRSSQLKQTLSTSAGAHGNNDWAHFMADGLMVCLSGWVVYGDESGKQHETFFCRAWSRVQQKFIIPDTMPGTYNQST
jgi:hypothetical protein